MDLIFLVIPLLYNYFATACNNANNNGNTPQLNAEIGPLNIGQNDLIIPGWNNPNQTFPGTVLIPIPYNVQYGSGIGVDYNNFNMNPSMNMNPNMNIDQNQGQNMNPNNQNPNMNINPNNQNSNINMNPNNQNPNMNINPNNQNANINMNPNNQNPNMNMNPNNQNPNMNMNPNNQDMNMNMGQNMNPNMIQNPNMNPNNKNMNMNPNTNPNINLMHSSYPSVNKYKNDYNNNYNNKNYEYPRNVNTNLWYDRKRERERDSGCPDNGSADSSMESVYKMKDRRPKRKRKPKLYREDFEELSEESDVDYVNPKCGYSRKPKRTFKRYDITIPASRGNNDNASNNGNVRKYNYKYYIYNDSDEIAKKRRPRDSNDRLIYRDTEFM